MSASAQRVYRRGGEVRSPSPHRGEGRGEGLRGGLERGISSSGSGETIQVRPDPDGAMSLHQAADLLSFKVWSKHPHPTDLWFSIPCHVSDLFEGACWVAFGALVLRRYLTFADPDSKSSMPRPSSPSP